MTSPTHCSKDKLFIHYSLIHGYVVPDSEDPFDGLDIFDPTGLVSCPFVKIPYDKDLDESHILEESLKKNKEKKRKNQNDGKEKTQFKEEEDGPVLKKVKEEYNGKVSKDMCAENKEDEIDICNYMYGLMCPLYKTMPGYKVPWPTFREYMAGKKRKEEMKEVKVKEEKK